MTTFTQTSSHHNHTTLTLNGCGVGVVVVLVWCGCGVDVVVMWVWCELVWVKVVTCGPPYIQHELEMRLLGGEHRMILRLLVWS